MKVLVSGSSGLVGSELVRSLGRNGHSVGRLIRVSRGEPKAVLTSGQESAVAWNLAAGWLDSAAAEGADAVVNLAGASIASGRWNEERKHLLRTSRIGTTRALVEALGKLARPPKIFVSASAVGYYGDRGDEELTESSATGKDFLAELVRDWEAEALRAQAFARVVLLRFGVILSLRGGALPRMLTPFKLGLGGRLGSGRQWMSWLTRADAIGFIRAALGNTNLRGPVNAVAPAPVRNADFTRILAKALHRPAIFPAPAFALRLALGEMAQALLLSSQRARPTKLLAMNHRFEHPELEPALRAVLSGAS